MIYISSKKLGTILRSCTALFLTILSARLEGANIIFDLGGVLTDTKKREACSQIGLFNLACYGGSPRNLFFEYLDSIVPHDPKVPITCDETGSMLPQLMYDWMTNNKTHTEIAEIIYKAAEKDTQLGSIKRKIIINMARMIFGDLEAFIKTKRIVKGGFDFALECKQAGHKIFILSNWDTASWELMKIYFPSFIKAFDGIVISGEVKLMKPDPAIFKFILDQYVLDPQKTVFIDDQLENIRVAQRLGLHCIKCPRKGIRGIPDFKQVKKEFGNWLRAGKHRY